MSARNFTTLRLSAILLAPTLLAHAQQTPTTATLHGTVLNAVTHQPIARALVTLDQYSQAMLTDNEGHFTFDGVPAGQTSLSVRRPGFAGGDASNTTRQMTAVPSFGDLTLELTPLCSIAGELILPGDDSPDSLQLQLLHQEIQNGRANWSIYRNAEATNDGHFRFGNLPAGPYLVHVGASPDPIPARPPADTVKIRAGYVPAFYPAAREIAAAGLITLSPGQQVDVKMELTREPYYPVSVPVANLDNARGLGFDVSSDSFLGLGARFSPADGMAHIDLPSGHYLIEGHSFGSRQMDGLREFDVNGTATRTGAITLLPLNRIPVTVHMQFTHTPVETGNDYGPTPPTATNLIDVNLQRAGGGPSAHGQRPNLQDDAQSAASGVSYLVSAAPGRYWVNARAFNGYIAAITSGGVDLLEDTLAVGTDGSAAPIEVTLRDDFATLAVTVAPSLLTTGAPLYFHLIPRSGPASGSSEMALQAQTSMNINNVAPGSYLAFASTSHAGLEYRNPKVAAAIAGKAQAVDIDPASTAHVAIDSLMPPGGPQ